MVTVCVKKSLPKDVKNCLLRREKTLYHVVAKSSYRAHENAIRPFTVGRKNWLFSDSVQGAEASAVVYTMVEMARAHDLNIYDYLKYILDQRPDQNWTDEQLADLAPWSEKLQHLKNRM